MTCNRCAGTLVQDWLTDILDETGNTRCEGLRCINCGNIQDSLIRRHQEYALAGRLPSREGGRRRMARLRY